MPSSDIFRMLNGEAKNLNAGPADWTHARAGNEIVGVKTLELDWYEID